MRRELVLRKLLEKQSKEVLINFIVEYAETDSKFANTVNVRFVEPVFEDEINKVECQVENALYGISDYNNRDSWGNVNFDVSDIMEEARKRVEQGHIKLAFAEIEVLYRKLLENFEYQGECEISMKAEDCHYIMAEIADKAVTLQDMEYIFNRCIILSGLEDGKDYGADYEDKLLRIAAKFVTPENLSELEYALFICEAGRREEEFQLIRLEIIRKLEGEDSADNFIADNLQYENFRKIAFDKAITREAFADAQRLCIDALSVHVRRYGISPWLYKLYAVYEMTNNTEMMMQTAEEILFCGDLKYYDILKGLLQEQTAWDNLYSVLLQKCEEKLYYTTYMEILDKEDEYALLLEQVIKHIDQIYRYGKLLAKTYPSEILAVFTKQINKEADTASKRKDYKRVCSSISRFAAAGYKAEAVEMIHEFKQKYRNRPAFVDELSNM